MKHFRLFLLALFLPFSLLAADYSVTSTSVIASDDAVIRRKTAGASITAGQAVYVKADGTLGLYDANAASPAYTFAGIALNSASSGQLVLYAESDPEFTPGFTVAAGAIVIGSSTAGGLCPASDLATGHYLTIVGIGIGSNKIDLSPQAAGVVTP